MDIASAVILGVVEGVTEFLPISSTGHLILASHLLGIEQSTFVKSFEIAIQLGAIAAAAFLYWRLFLRPDLLKRIAIAFVPTAIAGLVFYNAIKSLFFGNEYVVLGALLLGGVALILFEIFHGEKEGSEEDLSKITYLGSSPPGYSSKKRIPFQIPHLRPDWRLEPKQNEQGQKRLPQKRSP